MSSQNSSAKKKSFLKCIHLSKNEILAWINQFFKVNLTLIEQLGSGTVYCQILDAIYPGQISLSKIKWQAKIEYDFVHNFKILQSYFNKMGIQKTIPINNLVKAKHSDNLEFIQWLKSYFDENYKGQGYDALKRRGNITPYFGFCKGGVLPNKTLFYRNSNEKFTIEELSSSSLFETGNCTPEDTSGSCTPNHISILSQSSAQGNSIVKRNISNPSPSTSFLSSSPKDINMSKLSRAHSSISFSLKRQSSSISKMPIVQKQLTQNDVKVESNQDNNYQDEENLMEKDTVDDRIDKDDINLLNSQSSSNSDLLCSQDNIITNTDINGFSLPQNNDFKNSQNQDQNFSQNQKEINPLTLTQNIFLSNTQNERVSSNYCKIEGAQGKGNYDSPKQTDSSQSNQETMLTDFIFDSAEKNINKNQSTPETREKEQIIKGQSSWIFETPIHKKLKDNQQNAVASQINEEPSQEKEENSLRRKKSNQFKFERIKHMIQYDFCGDYDSIISKIQNICESP